MSKSNMFKLSLLAIFIFSMIGCLSNTMPATPVFYVSKLKTYAPLEESKDALLAIYMITGPKKIDAEKNEALLNDFSKKGNPVAQYYIGANLCGQQKYKECLEWLKKSADQGFGTAMLAYAFALDEYTYNNRSERNQQNIAKASAYLVLATRCKDHSTAVQAAVTLAKKMKSAKEVDAKSKEEGKTPIQVEFRKHIMDYAIQRADKTEGRWKKFQKQVDELNEMTAEVKENYIKEHYPEAYKASLDDIPQINEAIAKILEEGKP